MFRLRSRLAATLAFSLGHSRD